MVAYRHPIHRLPPQASTNEYVRHVLDQRVAAMKQHALDASARRQQSAEQHRLESTMSTEPSLHDSDVGLTRDQRLVSDAICYCLLLLCCVAGGRAGSCQWGRGTDDTTVGIISWT